MGEDKITRLTPEELEAAKARLKPIFLSPRQFQLARLRLRPEEFYRSEPAIYNQRYLGTTFEGRRINSCLFASSIIALVRMGVVTTERQKLERLEEELVRSGLQAGAFAGGELAGVSTPYLIFRNFGLQTGFARSLEETVACLAAGGCAIASFSSHARCITEVSRDQRAFKVFDPLPLKRQSETLAVNSPQLQDIFRRFGGGVTRMAVVYPPDYKPEASKCQTFAIPSYSFRNEIKVNTGPFLRS